MHKPVLALLTVFLLIWSPCGYTQSGTQMTLPSNLQGNWTLDESASYRLAQSHSRWQRELKHLFPNSIELHRDLVIRVGKQTITLEYPGKAVALDVTFVNHKKTFTSLTAEHKSLGLKLAIRQHANGTINITGASQLISEFLVWRIASLPPSR